MRSVDTLVSFHRDISMIKVALVAVLIGIVKAECGNCDGYTIKDPVCAFDGRTQTTFTNACEYKIAVCKYADYGITLQVVNQGECRDSNVKPQVSTQTGSLTTDVCSEPCTSTEPYSICGSDGNTYQNKCDFLKAQCKYKLSSQRLDIASTGACRKVDTSGLAIETSYTKPTTSTDQCNMDCSTMMTYPICGSDGVTYRKYICVFRQGSVLVHRHW
ncbi:hypothetical protein ACF0H5_008985 [Mactra antiquata]